jgi:MFS family permease
LSPIATAIQSVRGAVRSFRATSMPVLSRVHYQRELYAWFFLPVMLGAAEGSVTGVIAKNGFAGMVDDRLLNIAVAILSGAPAFSNITSFLWTALSHGRNKIRFIVGMQVAASLLVAMIALAPADGWGLLLLVLGAVGTRMCWAGVVTLRTNVWRANFPKPVRAKMAGKLATVQTIMLGGVGLVIALAMRSNEQAFHLLFPIAAVFGLVGATIYSKLRMRRHSALLNAERSDIDRAARVVSPARMLAILKHDVMFRRYMGAMFIFGLGNLSITAPLIIMLREEFHYEYLYSILITGSIPILMMPLVIPFWSKLLDRMHIIQFRAIHCWSFVITNVVVLVGAVTLTPLLIWGAAVLRGVCFGGGVLGWNLGHHDFATDQNASQYMSVHVTLTGLRGLIGPPLIVGLYEWLNRDGHGHGPWVFAVCLALNLTGAFLFTVLRAIHAREHGSKSGHIAG